MSHPPDTSPAPARAGRFDGGQQAFWSGVDHGNIMGVELVAGILLWSGIGYLVDRWLSTAPVFLIIGAFVGFGGGLYLIWLRSGRMEQAERDRQEAERAARRPPQRGGAREH